MASLNLSQLALARRFNQLDTRRRVWVTAACLVVLAWLAYQMMVAPMVQESESISAQLEGLQARVTVEKLKKDKLAQKAKDPGGKTPEQELAELEARLTEVKTRLEQRTSKLVPPTEMVALLRDVFSGQRRIRLVDVESLKPEPINTQTRIPDETKPPATKSPAARPANNAQAPGAEAAAALPEPEPEFYRHAVNLTFEGRYRDVARYLARLEKMPWQFYWGEMNLTVADYPTTRVHVEVYTLSREKAWLGV